MVVNCMIQARMGSTRLPGKVLKPLGNRDILEYVVNRCQAMPSVHQVIVATSELEEDDSIEKWCREREIIFHRGSPDDVLRRFITCEQHFPADYVMRVTSDCPFIDYHLGEFMIETMKKSPCDRIHLKGNRPRGLAPELFSTEALKRIDQLGQLPRHREHVTYYAYEYPEQFSSVTVEFPPKMRFAELRITVDTEEDYHLCQAVADHFSGQLLVPSQEVVDYLLAHPEVVKINAHIEQKPII
jgi:spore coat polysaccharide biosynthesis protein SpsF